MKVLVATDGSPSSKEAVEKLLELMPHESLEAIVVSVAPIPVPADVAGLGGPFTDYVRLIDEVQAEARGHLDAAVSLLAAKGIQTKTVLGQGDAASQILEVARNERPDLIVVGSHGRTGFKKMLLGSVSSRIVTDAHVPVLVVKSAQEP